MRGQFTHIASLVRAARTRTIFSQSELSFQLGYKNGQFISNVERAKCSLPLKKMIQTCELLNIDPEVMKEAMMKDLGEMIDVALNITHTPEVLNDAVTHAS